MTQNWTLVQHSGYGYAGNPTFRRAVEVRSVTDGRTARAVKSRGGVLFSSYVAASDAEDLINGIKSESFLAARGDFSEYQVDGLRLYLPAEEELGVLTP